MLFRGTSRGDSLDLLDKPALFKQFLIFSFNSGIPNIIPVFGKVIGYL